MLVIWQYPRLQARGDGVVKSIVINPAVNGSAKYEVYISPKIPGKFCEPARNTATGNTVLSNQPQVADVEETRTNRLLMVCKSALPVLHRALKPSYVWNRWYEQVGLGYPGGYLSFYYGKRWFWFWRLPWRYWAAPAYSVHLIKRCRACVYSKMYCWFWLVRQTAV